MSASDKNIYTWECFDKLERIQQPRHQTPRCPTCGGELLTQHYSTPDGIVFTVECSVSEHCKTVRTEGEMK